MNRFLKLLPAALFLALAACESTTPPRPTTRVADRPITRDRAAGSSTSAGQNAHPDAQLIYQNSTSGTHGRSTSSGIYQQRGAVTEEIHIGNQRLYPGQSPATHYRGNLQPGFVPSGTTGIYDPSTGRVIPIRR